MGRDTASTTKLVGAPTPSEARSFSSDPELLQGYVGRRVQRRGPKRCKTLYASLQVSPEGTHILQIIKAACQDSARRNFLNNVHMKTFVTKKELRPAACGNDNERGFACGFSGRVSTVVCMHAPVLCMRLRPFVLAKRVAFEGELRTAGSRWRRPGGVLARVLARTLVEEDSWVRLQGGPRYTCASQSSSDMQCCSIARRPSFSPVERSASSCEDQGWSLEENSVHTQQARARDLGKPVALRSSYAPQAHVLP